MILQIINIKFDWIMCDTYKHKKICKILLLFLKLKSKIKNPFSYARYK